jgi:hypothetical protein
MNNRGQFQIWGIVSVIAIISVVLAFFVFSTKFRYIILGAGLVVGAFFVLIKAEVKQKTKTTLFILLLAVGLFFVMGSGILQSILSVSSVNVGADGKVYWVATGVADQLDAEKFTFNFKPTNYPKSDGSVVSPKGVDIYINKRDSYCTYVLNKKATIRTFLFIPYPITYYELLNPAKTVNIDVSDSKGGSVTMDGTIVSSQVLNDKDGSGKVTVQTNGLLSGKMSCPESSDVIILNNKFVSKSAYLSASGINVINGLAENTRFIQGFKTAPVIDGTSSVRGDVDVGNVVFTFTADQDYFNSVIYTPAPTGKPEISNIAINSIKGDSTGTASVTIKNLNSGNSLFNVKASISNGIVNPSSQNEYISGSKTLYFNVKTNKVAVSDKLVVTVCSVNQFGSATCDTESKSFDITSATPTVRCGDGVCSSNENNVTCSADCKLGVIPTPLVCTKWWQEEGTETSYKYSILGIKFGATEQKVCKTAGWLTLTEIMAVIVILGGFALYLTKPKRRK